MIWTKKQKNFLIKNYPLMGKLWCAKKLNVKEGSIRAKASELKLKQNKNSDFFKKWQEKAANSKVGKKRPLHSLFMKKLCKEREDMAFFSKPRTSEEKKNISEQTKKWIKEKGHPRGMLGKHHTKETREKFLNYATAMWEDKNSYVHTKEYRQKLSDRMSKLMVQRLKDNPQNVYSRTIKGWRDVGGQKHFFRSKWEMNIAYYLEWLKIRGDIKNWEFEAETFWFEKIRRGVRSYLPDFRITENNGTIYFIEVKGWMDSKSKTKLARMKKYYPDIKVVLYDEEQYKTLKRQIGKICNWE